MKNRFAVVAVAIAATVITAGILTFTPTRAAKTSHMRASRTAKFDWATLPVGIASSIATLTADEQSRINTIQSKLKSDSGMAKSAGSRSEVASKVRALDEQAGADVMAVLTPDQVTAIEADAPVFALLKTTIGFQPEALDQLTLTSDQLAKLKDIATDNDAKQKTIDDEAKAKSEDLRTATRTEAATVFTPEQQALLTEHHAGVRTRHKNKKL